MAKDKIIKDAVTEELQRQKIEEMKKQLQNERTTARQAMIDKVEEGRYVKDRKGNLYDRWENVARNAEEASKMDGKSYNTWQSTILDLVNMYFEVTLVLNQELKELFVNAVNLGLQAKDMATDKFLPPPKAEVVLPKLLSQVEMDEENKIDLEKLKLVRYEGDKLGKAVDDLFKKGVKQWLEGKGYKANPAEPGKWIHIDTGVELNKATFDSLKNDPDTGLTATLSQQHEVDIEERPSPAP